MQIPRTFSGILSQMPEKYSGPRLPLEQLSVRAAITGHNYYPHEDIILTTSLHEQVLTVISSERITLLKSRARTKNQNRIREKFRRVPTSPILDIYGIRVIVDENDITKTVEAIREHWPMPEEFPWEGVHGNLKTTRSGGNEFSNPMFGYNTIRMNIMFEDKIAEIQVATPEQDEKEKIIWADYVKRQREELK